MMLDSWFYIIICFFFFGFRALFEYLHWEREAVAHWFTMDFSSVLLGGERDTGLHIHTLMSLEMGTK